jgi:hypothetical protein
VFLLRRLFDLIAAFDEALLEIDDEVLLVDAQILGSITRA